MASHAQLVRSPWQRRKRCGAGSIPHAVLRSLDRRKDLGIHTEMLSDGMMELAQAGVIRGRKKTLLPGKMVTSFVMGTRKLYEWVHDNPAIEMCPTEFTNDPDVIARNCQMVAINSVIRFLGFKKQHPHEEMQQLVDLDYEDTMAIVACTSDTQEILGIIRYDVDPATKLADIAFVVRDDWEHRGVGTLMMRRMKEIAFATGLAGFTADVLATNAPAMAIFHESGLQLRSELRAGVYHLCSFETKSSS